MVKKLGGGGGGLGQAPLGPPGSYGPLLIFKCQQNWTKIELKEEFIAMWREEQSLLDVMSPLYRDKNEKDKSLERMSDKFHTFSK